MLGALIGLLALAGVIAAIVAAVASGADVDDQEFVFGREGSKNRFLSIRVDGVILGEEAEAPGSIFFASDAAFGYEIKEKLREAALDPSIKGVVLEFQTPGGTVYGSSAIADGIEEYRRVSGGKPVLAWVKGLSASGGMWGMAPANRILADHGSLIGSIGVILGTIEYYDGVIATEGGFLGGGVTTRNGITYTTLSAGRSKDVGSPYRPLTDEEKRILQRGLDDLYAEFVAHVAKHRSLNEATIRDQMGAHIFSNRQAQELGLIDGTASREEAYAELAKLAGITSADWQVVREGGGGLFGGAFSKAGDSPPQSSICFPPNAMLVYYGEPAALCRR
jgi:protease-4